MSRKNKHRKRSAVWPKYLVLWVVVFACVAVIAWEQGWLPSLLERHHIVPEETQGISAMSTPSAVEPVFVSSSNPEAITTPTVTEAASSSPTVCPTPEITPKPTPEPTPTPAPSLTIVAVGDIMIHEKQLIDKHRGEDPYDFSCWFTHVKDSICQADLAIANFETTLVPPGSKYTGFPRFRSPIGIVTALKDAGFDVLTTANNHCFDGDWKGVVYTAETIREMGLAQTGTYLSQDEFDDVLIVEENGFRIGILAYSYTAKGPKPYAIKGLNKKQMAKDIELCKEKGAHIIVAMVHWGVEFDQKASKQEIELTQYLWEQGVDLVLGSHPHVLQTMDRQKVTRADGTETECAVIYSMGNFISNQKTTPRDVGIIYRAKYTMDGEGKPYLDGIEYVPTWVNLVKETAASRHYEVLPVGVALDDPTIVTEYNDTAKKRLRKAWDATLELMNQDTYGQPMKR